MRKEFGKSLIAVCSHPKSIPSPTASNDELIKNISKGDKIIFGGGGLFYSTEAVKEMIWLAKICKEKGANTECHGVGIEGDAYAEDSKLILEFMQLMEKISVRSIKSVEMLKQIGIVAQLRQDFVFNLPSPASRFHRGRKIGIVVASSYREEEEMRVLAELVRKLSEIGEVILIPHCRHFTGVDANDCLTNEMLFIKTHLPEKVLIESWAGTPRQLLEQYSKLDYIVTMRFHGMILGMICNRENSEKIGISCLSHGIKYASFAEEHSIAKHTFDLVNTQWIENISDEINKYFETRKFK